jgi:hypothetical protein
VPALWGAASYSKTVLAIVHVAETAMSQSAMLLLEIGVHIYSYRHTESSCAHTTTCRIIYT